MGIAQRIGRPRLTGEKSGLEDHAAQEILTIGRLSGQCALADTPLSDTHLLDELRKIRRHAMRLASYCMEIKERRSNMAGMAATQNGPEFAGSQTIAQMAQAVFKDFEKFPYRSLGSEARRADAETAIADIKLVANYLNTDFPASKNTEELYTPLLITCMKKLGMEQQYER